MINEKLARILMHLAIAFLTTFFAVLLNVELIEDRIWEIFVVSWAGIVCFYCLISIIYETE